MLVTLRSLATCFSNEIRRLLSDFICKLSCNVCRLQGAAFTDVPEVGEDDTSSSKANVGCRASLERCSAANDITCMQMTR